MDNKEKRIKSLTWKYFWQQKWEEIKYILLLIIIMIGTIFIPYLIGRILPIPNLTSIEITNSFAKSIYYWINGTFFILIILLCVLFIYVFIDWILSNWKKAKKRATREIGK